MKKSLTKDQQLRVLSEVLAYLNMEAQRHLLGLDNEADDVRQLVCNAMGILTGDLYCGNLQRKAETLVAILENDPFVPDDKANGGWKS